MRRAVVLLTLAAGCGRLNFGTERSGGDAAMGDAVTGGVDAPDAPPSNHTIPPNAVLWMRLDDQAADGVIDSAGTHVGTCTSCPVLIPGRIDGAQQFTNDRIDVDAAPDLLPGTGFTVAAWVRIDAAPMVGNVIVVGKEVGTDLSYGLLVSSARQAVFYTSSSNMQMAGSFALGEWHHVAMTWNGSLKLGYVDGVQATSQGVPTILSDAAGQLGIGDRSQPSSIPLTGAIDDVVFYQRVLSPGEIGQLANP